ncbi:MAG TPA: glycosyl hydrolase 53 family protein [Bacteroidales bacterium]|nr:glycosyl hydrolase 53 family protein [Bacteroidales bacterium]HPS62993.1 glycosyl hydrolase 53 family protein [Bacteroidales bacterium]
MRNLHRIQPLFLALAGLFLLECSSPEQPSSRYKGIGYVETGTPSAVMLTCYSTTLIANGTDCTAVRIALADSLGRQLAHAGDSVRLYLDGEGKITTPDGAPMPVSIDTAGKRYVSCRLTDGLCRLRYISGVTPGTVKIEARSGRRWPGSHEIHLLPAGFVVKHPTEEQLRPAGKPVDRMIGADISFLPQLEDRGMRFFENGQAIDALRLLKEHGFNYIRLRIFVNPENEKGYAPGKGYCDLAHTLIMARRIREAGMKLLLDFHYSDYWADPQQQYKPKAWEGAPYPALKDSVRSYTTRVIRALAGQGTPPSIVQVGNEINHGMLWPEGHISRPDQLAGLLQAGTEGVAAVDPAIPVMMHIALGGQHDEAVFWLDNMIARGVKFDVIGLSYYPRWHGTLEDLDRNVAAVAGRYGKPVNIVEYSDFKGEVTSIGFDAPGGLGRGSCIWEPLGFRSGLFDRNGNVTSLFVVYDSLAVRYQLSRHP